MKLRKMKRIIPARRPAALRCPVKQPTHIHLSLGLHDDTATPPPHSHHTRKHTYTHTSTSTPQFLGLGKIYLPPTHPATHAQAHLEHDAIERVVVLGAVVVLGEARGQAGSGGVRKSVEAVGRTHQLQRNESRNTVLCGGPHALTRPRTSCTPRTCEGITVTPASAASA